MGPNSTLIDSFQGELNHQKINIRILYVTKFSHILGSVSCVQVFNRALNPAEINLKKYCPDANRASLVVPCPNGYEFDLHIPYEFW